MKSAPELNTKTKIAKTKTIALKPHARISSSMAGSTPLHGRPVARCVVRRFAPRRGPVDAAPAAQLIGTKPWSATIFCPAGERIHSRYAFNGPWASPSVYMKRGATADTSRCVARLDGRRDTLGLPRPGGDAQRLHARVA